MRIKMATNSRKKKNKMFRLSKGYIGNKSKSYRIAKEAVEKSFHCSYIGRKRRKRDMRSLWIARVSAGAKENGLSYSLFINLLKDKGIFLNRKILAELSVNNKKDFSEICGIVKNGV